MKHLLTICLLTTGLAICAGQEPDVHLTFYQQLQAEGGPKWKNDYPPATTCKECHPTHYRQWSVSPHAYAQMSPVFNAMHATIFKKTNGTSGDFCIRCHTPVGMNLGEPEFMSNIDRHPTSREGVTCIVCHRINTNYGKISGRIALERGNLIDVPVTTPNEKIRLKEIIAQSNVSTDTQTESGTKIHQAATYFAPMQESGFCGSCHDVLLHNGFRLEEAFSEYKRSPAAKQGISCQDCHMGVEHGAFSGDDATNYHLGGIATVDGDVTQPRKMTNHMFPGPDHSVIHPGIFPHNDQAVRDESEDPNTAIGLATIREWLTFDVDAGWGSKAFEQQEWQRVKAGQELTPFPERWQTRAGRQKARRIIDGQLDLLGEYQVARNEVLRNGFQLGDIDILSADRKSGIDFQVDVLNATTGHGVPTGFIGERVIFLQVTVLDVGGNLIYASGDLDPNGDVRDLHSLYVHNHELPLDKDLFTLQSRFLTTNVRGNEREVVLPIPFSLTPLPYINPQSNASTLEGRPTTARIHKNNIMPNDHRIARYRIPASQLTGNGPYRADIRFVVGMVPINLIHEIKDVGFDYDMSARDIAAGVLKGHTVLWERTLHFNFDTPGETK
jgi:nitrate/TMAO reductase-like tetraheme cytochrome c subunit